MGANRSVLVVDDDPSVARLVCAVLTRDGLTTDIALDGPSALQRMERGGIALVLTDMTMPGMTGLELLREAESRGLSAPFLLMSAFLDVPTERAILAEPGIVGVLRKPFELERLLADVQTLFAAITRSEVSRSDDASSASGCSAAPCLTLALAPQWLFLGWPGTPILREAKAGHGAPARHQVPARPGHDTAAAVAGAVHTSAAPLSPC